MKNTILSLIAIFVIIGSTTAHALDLRSKNSQFPINKQIISCQGGYISDSRNESSPNMTGEAVSPQLRILMNSKPLVNLYGPTWSAEINDGDKYIKYEVTVDVATKEVNKVAIFSVSIADAITGKSLVISPRIYLDLKRTGYFEIYTRLSSEMIAQMNKDQFAWNGDPKDMQNLSDMQFGWAQLSCGLEMEDGRVVP